MDLRVERKLTGLDAKLLAKWNKEIDVLEKKGDPKSILDKDELDIYNSMGHERYLAKLKRIREAMLVGDGSEE